MICPKKHLLTLSRDVQNFDERNGVLRLDMNEYVPHASILLYDKLMKRLTPEVLSAYPLVNEAYHSISRLIGEREEKIVLTPGSDGVIYSTLMAFCKPGDTIAYVEPTYGMYGVYSAMMNLNVKTIHHGINKTICYEDILNCIDENLKVFILANPNGVTGRDLPFDFVVEMIKKGNHCGTIILLDEVYAAFQDCGHSRYADLTDKYDNLVIARSFSKSYGLAGVRAGYSLSHEVTRKLLISVRNNVEINSVAVEAIRTWCDYPQELKACIETVVNSKKQLGLLLTEKGLEWVAGCGNFLLIHVPNQNLWQKQLLQRQISVKWLQLDGECWIRVTVGSFAYMERFINFINQLEE